MENTDESELVTEEEEAKSAAVDREGREKSGRSDDRNG